MARRNNILAGAFVLISLVMAVWVSFVLSGREVMGGTRTFTVRFTLSQGAAGLKDGSSLLLAGQEVGKVVAVSFVKAAAPEGTGDLPQGVDVRVKMRADLQLYENAAIHLEKPLLGNLSSLNIVAVGDAAGVAAPQHGSSRIDNDDIVLGRLAPPAFLTDAGFGPEQSDQLRSAVASAELGLRKITQLIDQAAPKVDAGVEDGRQLIADLKASLAEWTRRIDTTAANVETASARLAPILDKADEGIAEATLLVKDIRAAVSDNRARIDAIIKNAESVTAKLDGESMTLLNDALRDGRQSLNVFSEAVGRVSALVGEQTPSLRRTLANLRLMSDQLKLTAVEVRSQPWRLLHQPTTKELSAQVLYDATRSYAEAASDLRSASESLEAASALHAAGRENPPDLAPLTQSMAEALTKYRQAERYLMDKLVEEDRK